LSGHEALLEGCILGLPGPIDEKPAEESRTRARGGTETGVPADRANYRAAACADRRAGQRPLLGWGHICASSHRHNHSRDQEQFIHGVLQSG
jgi:hypothetical protein